VFPASVNTIPIQVFAPPGASVFACISLPHLPLPTHLGNLWLDPSPGGIVLAASGITDPTGEFSARSGLNGPWPSGVTPAFQAVVVDRGHILLSEPVVGVGATDVLN
jgi:hypothetical protein